MTDLLTRLRRLYVQHGTDYVQEAADEIERLRAELARKDEFYTRLAEVHEGAMKMWESDERECAMKAYEMAAENKGLREEVERLRHDIERHIAMASELATENEALRAELAEARRDAGRYRRLCSLVAWGTLGVCRVAEAGDDYADDGVMLDAWLDDPEMIAEVQGIDAAMAGGEHGDA